MSYFLSFVVQKLHREGDNIIYDREMFAENPLRLSTPASTAMIQAFLNEFEKVGVVVSKPKELAVVHTQTKTHNGSSKLSVQLDHPESESSVASLQPVESSAFILRKKEISKLDLQKLCLSLVDSLKSATAKLSEENILTQETSILTEEMQELLELRNYLCRFVMNSKEVYKNGYLYITEQ